MYDTNVGMYYHGRSTHIVTITVPNYQRRNYLNVTTFTCLLFL